MPDVLDYKVTVTGGAPAPQFAIEARVVDSQNQTVLLKDLTGNRALMWPAAFSTLTDVQQDALRQIIGDYLLRATLGMTDPATGR